MLQDDCPVERRSAEISLLQVSFVREFVFDPLWCDARSIGTYTSSKPEFSFRFSDLILLWSTEPSRKRHSQHMLHPSASSSLSALAFGLNFITSNVTVTRTVLWRNSSTSDHLHRTLEPKFGWLSFLDWRFTSRYLDTRSAFAKRFYFPNISSWTHFWAARLWSRSPKLTQTLTTTAGWLNSLFYRFVPLSRWRFIFIWLQRCWRQWRPSICSSGR